MEQSLVQWLILLGLGFPLLSILLGEAVERLERQSHPGAIALRQIRQYVLPPLALLLVARKLFNITNEAGWTQIVETLTWGAIIVAGISSINALLTINQQPLKGQIQVPNLFFQVFRGGLILTIAYHIFSSVWKIDLSQIGTSVGIASAVIALALQDTISNLASGLLLLTARPFKVGDWIEFDGKQGRVIDQNWWSVSLLYANRRIIVPNGVLAKATIDNYGTEPIAKSISVSFSYDDSPDQVIPVLNSLVTGIDLIKSEGNAFVSSYGDFAINYELWYKVLPENNFAASSKLNQRMYYMTKRYGFTMTYPITVNYNFDNQQAVPSQIPQVSNNRQEELLSYLRSLAYFYTIDNLNLEKLASKAKFQVYSKDELITQEGKLDNEFYILYQGNAEVKLTDSQGRIKIINRLRAGDAFGEMALYPEEISPVTIIAGHNTEVIVIPAKEILQLIQSNSKFASEMVQFIEDRKKAVALAKSIPNETVNIYR
ncbi:cyclic nucleotide-binding domain-containing protein [Gloeocapsa sp. PCC 73106]|uniref:cyclic nucleotide-binding domain-containing protein n=1 Tax=Gloeocapsa sp. PCC 73106 TaxID=102232 RepID=UPI0002ABD73A|nr:cyclic nucleotide-binding domain-containing protein [Gloeocapsa sp. PCC 73106]ELR99164.1 small-conductance mechanosensitive channel [Gloeocapsa sp. PCC 73106]